MRRDLKSEGLCFPRVEKSKKSKGTRLDISTYPDHSVVFLFVVVLFVVCLVGETPPVLRVRHPVSQDETRG